MNYKITEVYLDMADKYIVRIIINENNSTFLKFDHYPTQDEINLVADKYVESITQIANNQ